jgi:hypothetical protein
MTQPTAQQAAEKSGKSMGITTHEYMSLSSRTHCPLTAPHNQQLHPAKPSMSLQLLRTKQHDETTTRKVPAPYLSPTTLHPQR